MYMRAPAPKPDAELGEGYVGGQHPVAATFGQGDAATVVARARQANIGLTVVSPLKALMPRGRWGEGGCDAFAGNEECAAIVQREPALRQWCVVNPLDPRTFEQAAALLRTKECAGLKFHPEEHCYEIRQYGQELFGFAARHAATVLVHSGDRHSAPMDFLPFADHHR
jgi:predicted TIM-barrel fold metal-dependent hydrolase